MSTKSIIFSSYNTTNLKNNELRIKLPVPYVSKNQEVALASASLFYSWPNVSSTYGNTTGVGYIFGGQTYPLTVPSGFYSITDLSNYIQLQMSLNGHYLLDSNGNEVYYLALVPNSIYYGATMTATPLPSSLPSGWSNPGGITLSGQTPQLVVSNSAFGDLIGFPVGVYPPTVQSTLYQVNSTQTPQISPVSVVNLGFNMVNQSVFNSYPSVIHTFNSGSTVYGGSIVIDPHFSVWYPCTDSSYQEFLLTLRDQNNRDLPLLDPQWNVTLVIRDRQK